MAGKWSRGHVSRFWNPEDYKKFNYVKQPLMDSEIDKWREQGYDYVKSFSGSMYDNRNPMPDWVNRFDKIFDLKNMTYNFYKMSQLEIMPEHVDHFQTYMRLYGVEYKNVRRILVMLDDWKPGHYLEIDGVGVVNWIAGDYFIWDSDVRHAASNIGIEDRYTLQITGTTIIPEEVYKNVHWYNMPDLETRKESLYSPEMAIMKNRMNKTNPYFIYMYNQQVTGLEKITHTPEAVQELNEKGVDIYLFEPLCSYLEGATQFYPPYGTKHTLLFYSEFHYDQTKNPSKMRSDELDSIVDYVDRNNLTNVTVHTCDFNVEKFYPFYLTKFKLATDDLFLSHFDTNEFEPLADNEDTSNFSRKFISMNWRYAPHRQLIATYLANLTDVHLSWYFKTDMGNVSVEPWYSIHNWIQKKPEVFNKMITGFRDLNNRSPYSLDLDVKEATSITHRYLKHMFPIKVIYDHKKEKYGDNLDRVKTYYNDVFCDIVTESRFAQPTSNYSEKAYRPMFYKKPFIMVGPPHTLQYMKEQGFQTFGDFWNEHYDMMEDHESRLFAIFKLIDQLNSMSIGELKDMYQKMLPIVEHNRRLLLEKCPLRS